MTTYSNCLTSAPLTAAGIEAAITNILACADQPLNIKPDTILVPPGFIERCILVAVTDCERLIRKLGERVVTGTQAQRRRRKAQGVVGRRHERRLRLERDLVAALKDLRFWEGMGIEL